MRVRNYRDQFRMKPDDDFTDWDVQHYGVIVDDYETVIGGRYAIRCKVYKYKDRYFMEVWNNGIRKYYGECCE